jgi:rubrerythrin
VTMKLLTAAQVVDFATRLEKKSASFYACLAEAYPDRGDLFQSYSRQNSKHAKQIEEAYRYAVTDALETGFSFNLEEDNYVLPRDLEESAQFTDQVSQATSIEKVAIQFFRDAADQSELLIADIPRLFRTLAKKKSQRLSVLTELESETTAR